MSEFGTNLKRLREQRGLTQQEIAETFFVTAATVSRWESGMRYPDLMMAKKLADFYEVPLDQILFANDFPEYVKKAPVMENDRDGRIQTSLYTLAAIAFVIRLIGFFLFPEVHDGSAAAYIRQASDILMTVSILIVLLAGIRYSFKGELSQRISGIIALIFFASQAVTLMTEGTAAVFCILPIICMVLTVLFFFQNKVCYFPFLCTMMSVYLFVNVLLCFLESGTYSAASTSFVTRYRFLWSFVNPLGVSCLLILLIWQVYSIYRKYRLAEEVIR